jgi:hypothetical protein
MFALRSVKNIIKASIAARVVASIPEVASPSILRAASPSILRAASPSILRAFISSAGSHHQRFFSYQPAGCGGSNNSNSCADGSNREYITIKNFTLDGKVAVVAG